ncbi:hypothetical protein DFJ73DRAFT_958808, partial [Zopfochytrium polystomum]
SFVAWSPRVVCLVSLTSFPCLSLCLSLVSDPGSDKTSHRCCPAQPHDIYTCWADSVVFIRRTRTATRPLLTARPCPRNDYSRRPHRQRQQPRRLCRRRPARPLHHHHRHHPHQLPHHPRRPLRPPRPQGRRRPPRRHPNPARRLPRLHRPRDPGLRPSRRPRRRRSRRPRRRRRR